MPQEMAVDLEEIKKLVATTKEKTAQVYAAINEMKSQMATVIDGNLWVGDDAISFKTYMLKDLGKAWSTARWLETVAQQLEAYVQRTVDAAETRAANITANIE